MVSAAARPPRTVDSVKVQGRLAPAGVGSCVIRSSCDVLPGLCPVRPLPSISFASSSIVVGSRGTLPLRHATVAGPPPRALLCRPVFGLPFVEEGDEWLAPSFPAGRCLPIPEPRRTLRSRALAYIKTRTAVSKHRSTRSAPIIHAYMSRYDSDVRRVMA